MSWKSPLWTCADRFPKNHRVSRAGGHMVLLNGLPRDLVSQRGQAKEVSAPRGLPSEMLLQRLSCARPIDQLKLLLKAEESKFSIGESSMFLVNTRENKLLETRQKLAEPKTNFFKSLLGHHPVSRHSLCSVWIHPSCPGGESLMIPPLTKAFR